MSKESTATKKAQELNRLAGYKRFTVIRTPLPGTGGGTLNDSWSVHDTKTGENYAIGSIYGMTALTVLAAQLRKQKVDAVSGASPGKRPKPVRHDDEEFEDDEPEDELNHYGVLGMKWGVRKDPQKAYERANKKLSKLESRIGRSEEKVAKLQSKTLRRQERANNALVFKKSRARMAAKSTRKLGQAYLRVQKRTAKAKKWYDVMEDAFKDTKISELKNTELGKKYANMTIDDMMSNTSSVATMTQLAAYYENKSRR